MQECREQPCRSRLLPGGVGWLRGSTGKRALWQLSECCLATLTEVGRLPESGGTQPSLHLSPDLRAPPSSSFCTAPPPLLSGMPGDPQGHCLDANQQAAPPPAFSSQSAYQGKDRRGGQACTLLSKAPIQRKGKDRSKRTWAHYPTGHS